MRLLTFLKSNQSIIYTEIAIEPFCSLRSFLVHIFIFIVNKYFMLNTAVQVSISLSTSLVESGGKISHCVFVCLFLVVLYLEMN